MSLTKLEIFKIPISDNSKFSFDKKAIEKINEFLMNENYIYVNHSTSIATNDIEEYGSIKTINRFLIVTLVYKDINASEFNLKNTSKKVREVVRKEIENGDFIDIPKIETEYDKKIQQLTQAISNSGKGDKSKDSDKNKPSV